MTVVRPLFESLNSGNVREFRSRIEGCLRPYARIILDMEHVKFVDSSGIGAILSFTKALAALGGSVALCSLTEPVRNLFELVHMHRILKIYPTREEAVPSFGPETKRE